MRNKAIPVGVIAFVLVTHSISILASIPSDINNDNMVDILDLQEVVDNWLLSSPSAGDIDNSGDVNFPDFAILANNWLWHGPLDDMVLIGGGEFWMGDKLGGGDPDEFDVHAVYVDSLYMGRYEITNQQYCDFLNAAAVKVVNGGIVYSSSDISESYSYCHTSGYSPYSQIDYSGGVFSVRTKLERDMSEDPIALVSWYGATAYCNQRSSDEGKENCYNLTTWVCDFSKNGYRLATEAEWEYAARGGLSGERFPWGEWITHSEANYYSSVSYFYDISGTRGYHWLWNDGAYPYTAPVGSFGVNGYGLYDRAGNVREWCNDWYDAGYYDVSPYDNPQGPASGTHRIIRGGCCGKDAVGCRVAVRNWSNPVDQYDFFGFRIVLDL